MGNQCSSTVSKAIPDRATMLEVVDALERLDMMLAANTEPAPESKKQVRSLKKVSKAVAEYQATLKRP